VTKTVDFLIPKEQINLLGCCLGMDNSRGHLASHRKILELCFPEIEMIFMDVNVFALMKSIKKLE
jgi:hypothetical protein